MQAVKSVNDNMMNVRGNENQCEGMVYYKFQTKRKNCIAKPLQPTMKACTMCYYEVSIPNERAILNIDSILVAVQFSYTPLFLYVNKHI